MKIKSLKYELVLFLFIVFFSCDDYIRTEVKKNIFVNIPSISSFVGSQIQLVASPTDGTYQYIWSSEHPDIATVDNSGLVKLVGSGTTDIVVKGGDISLRIPVTSIVRIPLTDISFRTASVVNVTSIEIKVGKNATIYVTHIPETANDIPKGTWKSENSDIAIVNEIGNVIGINKGQTTIIYTIGDIVKTIDVTVS